MGNFSFISKNHKEAVLNPWKARTLCELQLISGGAVVEVMRGVYSGYGAVDVNDEFQHVVLVDGIWKDITAETKVKSTSCDGDLWVTKSWDEINDTFYDSSVNGIAAWHLPSLTDRVPFATEKSDMDKYQGDDGHDDDGNDWDEHDDDESGNWR
jgi:hypothetical protein